MLLLIFISSLFGLFGSDSVFEPTQFYSTPTSDIKMSYFQTIEDNSLDIPVVKKNAKKDFSISMNREHLKYFKSLSATDQQIFIKISSLGIFDNIKEKKNLSAQYSMLYKKDGAFNLETVIIVPVNYQKASHLIRDYKDYNNWLLKDVNIRRNGEKGKYFVDIDSLNYLKDEKLQWFDTRITLRTGFRGNYRLDLLIFDQTQQETIPSFTLKMREASKLAKEIEGTFKFITLPGTQYFVTYFTGRAELTWALYRFLPLALVRTQVLERATTMLENIQYKAETIEQKSK
ncbi:MAG: hypothetical protein WCQ47_06380 [bacterium]